MAEGEGRFSKRVHKMRQDRAAEDYRSEAPAQESILPEFSPKDSPSYIITKLLDAYARAVYEGNLFALQRIFSPEMMEAVAYKMRDVNLGGQLILPVLDDREVELVSQDNREWKLLLSYQDKTEYHDRGGNLVAANPGEDVRLLLHVTKNQPAISGVFLAEA